MNPGLRDLVDRHKEMAWEWREKNRGLIFGVLCSYVPVEILQAFDILPVRLWGKAENIEKANFLLPAYICSPVRNIMALGLSGQYDFLDGIIHSYSCDATCGLFNIWCRNLKPKFSFLLSPPYMDNSEAMVYYLAELRTLIAALEDYTKKPFSAERLKESIKLYDTAREQVREIYQANRNGATVSYLDRYYINLALQLLPVQMLVPCYQEYLLQVRTRGPGKAARHRILISGSVVSDVDILARIEELGGNIVVDDTCLGFRLVQDRVYLQEDPLSALAKYYLERPACSSRADFPGRKNYILKMISAFDVNAVIFLHQKFCDPHLSDHPFLKKLLNEKGIPQMQLELEGEGLSGRVRTCLESFFEMLEAQ